MKTNVLYYGDNLDILRRYIPDESVDLIYLDPPFNSNRDYNVIFKDESGRKSDAQLVAFEDTWHWGPDAERVYEYLTNTARHEGRVPDNVSTIIAALRHGIGENQMMAYLVEMAGRLVELRRVLKSTGSIYLHCDPTASHYLKVLLDAIFGNGCFRNEVVWCYRKWSVAAGQFVRNHDILLFYSKVRDGSHTFNVLYTAPSEGTQRRWKGKKQQAVFVDGVRTATSVDGEEAQSPMPDWWEISVLNPNAAERLGYPTQKPLALVERIVEASSNPGDVILDPFCGCGTALVAAEKLGRKWVGIDITYLSIAVMKARLKDSFGLDDIEVIGQPTEVEGARQLAVDHEGRYQFQWWALGLVDAKPVGGSQKKGADKGIDGKITFTDQHGKLEQVLVSVKSGHVNASHIRDLKGTLEREKAAFGLFITLEEPTRNMREEAATAGFWHSDVWNDDYERIQILSIADLLERGKKPHLPAHAKLSTYERAERVDTPLAAEQGELFRSGG